MDDGGVDAYREALLAHAEVVTPNLREAAMLCDVDVHDVKNHDDMVALARQLLVSVRPGRSSKAGHFARTFAHRAPRAPTSLVRW